MHQPKIIVPIQPKTLLDAKKKLVAAEKAADIVEVWLDQVAKLDTKLIGELIKSAKKPLLLNLKDAKEQGTFRGSAEERVKLLAAGAKAGAQYIDLPLTLDPGDLAKFRKLTKKGKLILSWHNFEQTPELKELRALAAKAVKQKADIIKLVSMANEWSDLRPIFEISWELAAKKKSFIVMAMGAKGEPTRIITPLIGGLGMFASLDEKSKTAPGQLTAGELKKWWTAFGCF